MEWVWGGIAALLLIGAVWYWRRRARRETFIRHKAEPCWQCGFDLGGCGARIDFRGDRRCPKCGELIEADEPGRVDDL